MNNNYYYYKEETKKLIKIIKSLIEKHKENKDESILQEIIYYNHILQKLLAIMKHKLD